MYLKLLPVLVLTLSCLAQTVVAEETAVAEPPIEEALPETPNTKFQLRFGEGGPVGRSIAEEIDIEMLDVERARALYDRTGDGDLLRLSLADCIALALKQNDDIIIASYDPQIAESQVYSAKGEFDPIWQTNALYLRATQSLNQQAIAFGGITSIDQYQTTIDSTIAGKLRTGTQYALAYNLSKEENTFGGFIEEFQTQVTLQLTQPLLRGFGTKYNTVRIQTARNLKATNELQVTASVMGTVAQVVRSYWDVVGAVEALKVAEAAVQNAERILQINTTRREIGTAADIEVLQAKAGVASRQSELITATARVADASDLLKQILNLREGNFLSKVRIVPLDRPSQEIQSQISPQEYDDALQAAMEEATLLRPEVKIAELGIENADLSAFQARRDALPQFDLKGSYTQGGRNHFLSGALEATRDADDNAYTYGFTASVPLGNRTARGNAQRAELTKRQAEQQLEKVRNGIMTNVSIAWRNVNANRVLVESNKQTVRLQEANVAAEEERLRLGVTTSWQVLQVQEALTAAQTQELQARIAYEKALTDLQLAKGTLLADMNVEFMAPDAEKPVGYFESLRPRRR